MTPGASEQEAAAQAGDELTVYHLTLFVNGASVRSANAVSDVSSMCETYLAGRFQLDVADVQADAGLVRRLDILVSPTLVRERPLPVRRLVGDLSDRGSVFAALRLGPEDGTGRGPR